MRTTSWMIAIFSCYILGCSKNTNNKEEERIATSRLQTSFDGLYAVLSVNSNIANEARADWPGTLSKIILQEPILKEKLTKRTGGDPSLAMVSTNVEAWVDPKSYGKEIAILLPESIENEGRHFHIGMRFSGEIVYFLSLPP